MQTGSKKPKSILTIDKRAIVHHRSYLFTFVFLLFVLAVETACSSNAKIQVQALDRTAMQDKINTIEGGIDASNSYKELTAKLSEEERDSLNLLLGRVIDRSPSKADKKATVTSILASIESVRKETTLQGKVKSAIDSLVFVSATFDASLRAFSDALQFSPVDSKLSYLALAEGVSKSASNDANILNAFESGLPSLGGEVVFVSSAGWNKIPSESALAAEFVSTLLKIASTTRSRDLESFLVRASDGKIQSKILEGLRGVSGTDAQIGNIVKVQNIVPEESLTVFNTLVALYSTNTTPAELKNSTIEALKKALVLRQPLLPTYFKELQSLSTQTDSNLLINSLVDSIDKTSGEAYFSQPKFTTKSISPYTVPGCTLPGSSTTKVTYSFKWAKNGSTLIDWTTQSFDRLASAGSLFALEDTTQCYVRVFVDGTKVADLNTELITVRSMPPIFTSGEPPQPQTFSAPKNVGFVYKVADRDPITDTGVFYKIVGLAQHGVVTQSEIGTFDYKPLTSYIGTDEFKFVACNLDDMCSSEKVITLNIVDGNQPPRLDRIIAPTQNTTAGGIKMSSDSTLNNIQLIIEDDDVVGSSCGIPNVIVTSGNTSKFPQSTSNIEVSGTFPYCKLKLAPAAGSAGLGTTTLTIKLDDGTNPQVTSTVDVTVLEKTPQWTTPATSTTFTINKNSGANNLYLNAATDADAGLFLTPQTLTYVIDSSPASGVGSLTGASAVPSSGNGAIVFTPTAGTSTTTDQSTTFTYKVCDNATPQNCTATKTVTVNVINNAPTISAIANPSAFLEGSNTGAIAFTIADIDDNITCSSVSKASSNTSLIPVANIVIGGSGTSCNVTVTPVADGNGGPVAITLLLNHKSATIDRTFLVTVNAVNDSPTLIATGATVGTTTTPEETAVNVILQSAVDVDTDPALNSSAQNLRYELVTAPAHGTLSGGNAVGVMSGISNESASTRTVTYTPATNYNGNDQFTYKICDSFSTSACTINVDVMLNVSAVNDAPTMTDIPYQITNEDIATTALAFTIGDDDNTVQCSQVTASSSNTTLVPNSTTNLAIGGSNGTVCSVSVTPVSNQNGSTEVTLTLNDGSSAANAQITKTFAVTFMPDNDSPTLSTIANQTIAEDNSTSALAFTIGDIDNTVQCSQVTASSSNSTLIPNTPSNLSIAGTAPNCTITVTPAANQNSASEAAITLSLNDGSSASNSTVTSTFNVTVNAINDTPNLTEISYQIINEGNPTSALNFTISDVDNAVQCSQVTATSDNPTLIPNDPINLAIGGAASQSCTITVTPAANQNGSATVTLELNDGSAAANAITTKTFAVSVVQVNNPPTLSTIADQTISEDISTSALDFTIGDVDNTVQCSQVNTSSSNSTLIPNTPSNLSITGTAPNCTITVTPAANQNSVSAATITLSLNDGSSASNSTVTSTFNVTVNAINDTPNLTEISYQIINEGNPTSALNFTISDVDNAVQCSQVTATSDNPTLIPNDPINLAIGGAATQSCTITVTPAAHQNGSATVTLALNDGSAAANAITTKTFVVSVIQVNNAPTLSTIANQTISEDNSTSALAFTIGDIDNTVQCSQVTASSSNSTLIPNAPSNLSIAGTAPNCTITVTPAANQNSASEATITLSLNDGSSASNSTVTSTFNVTVNAVNDAPTISAIPNQIINEDSTTSALSFTIDDVDNTSLNCNSVTASSSLTSLIESNATALAIAGGTAKNCTITVTPLANQNSTVAGGHSTITISLSDGTATTAGTFTMTVVAVNDPPTLTGGDDSGSQSEDNNLTISFGSGTDPDTGDTLNYNFVTLPQHGTLGTLPAASAGGNVTYTPQANYNGTDSFTYRICDQLFHCSSALKTVNMTITSTNDVPVLTASTSASNMVQASESGSAVTLTLAGGTDADGDTLSAKVVALPAQGTLQGSPTVGATIISPINYTPPTGQTGIFTLVYNLCDSSNACSVDQTVHIEVLAKEPQLNGAAATSVYNISENAGATIIDLDGATDPDAHLFTPAQSKTYTIEKLINLGTLGTPSAVASNGTGTVSYTPSANTSGVEQLRYKVCDSATTPNCTAFKYITINIGVPDYPILLAAGDSIKETTTDTAVDFVLGRFVDLGDSTATLVYEFTANTTIPIVQPPGNPKSSTAIDRTVTYTPDTGFNGTETFKYKVCRQGTAICSVEYSVQLVTAL